MKKIIVLSLLFCASITFAQDDLMKELDTKSDKKEVETTAFKGLQICNIQSTKLPSKKEWYVIISHRFGDIARGFDNFFGLDEAQTKIGAIYGATNWLSLGLSRHRNNKTYEFAAKYKMANQEIDGFPVTIVGYNTMDINSELKKDLNPNLTFSNRLAYSTQLLVSRKFSDKFSLQMTPICIRKNLYEANTDQKDLLLLGTGFRYKLSKRISFNADYANRLNISKEVDNQFQNPLSVGFDIDTGGHIFQMVFCNSQPMNDIAAFSSASGRWDGTRSLFFGFNMYRVF